jgi:lysyl-tRNA synthetase class 2
MGFMTVDALQKLSPGKLFNDLCGYNKKNKAGLTNPAMDDVKRWTGQ